MTTEIKNPSEILGLMTRINLNDKVAEKELFEYIISLHVKISADKSMVGHILHTLKQYEAATGI